MEKIDIHNSQETYDVAIKKLKEEKDITVSNKKDILKFLDDSAIGKTARKNASTKQVGVRARLKNLYLLKVSTKYFNKDFDKLEPKDMEKFIRALNDNTFKKVDGEKYSEQTKSNIKREFIIFLRWKLKEGDKFYKLTDWIETKFKRKEIPSLREEEIYALLGKCNTIKQKFLIAFLFDSGCRIEEFLNIRLSDIVKTEGDVKYYRATIRNEFSKTLGRTIGLFWQPTTELIDQWLELHPDKNNLDAQLYPSTYNGIRRLIYKIGERINKKLNAHLFRHSSATYYAGKLNRQLLCKRYGWSFSSNMPDRYIDRAGVDEEKVSDDFKNMKIEDIQNQLNKVMEQNKALKDNDSFIAKDVMEFIKIFAKNKALLKNMPKDDLQKLKELMD